MKDKRIAILFLTIFIDLLGFGIVIPILPNLAKTMASASASGLNPDVAVGLVAAVFSIIQFLFAPLFGALSDRIGRRPIILGSIVANVLGYTVFGFAGSFATLLIARIISGFGSANISAAQAYIADISDAKDRAKKMGIIGAAFGLGFVFGPPLGGWLYSAGSHSNYGGMMFVGLFTALLCVLNFVLAFVLLPESNTQMGGVRRKPIDTFKGMAKAWNIEIIGELLLINFIYITAFSMMQINAAVLWKEHYSLSPKAIGNIFGVIGVFSAIVQGGLIGFFQKKIGLNRMLLWGCPIAGLGLTLIPLPSLEWFYPVQVLAILFLAVGNGLLTPSVNSLVSLHSPADAQGKMLGILQSMGSLARSIGPLASGFLYAQYYRLPYFAGGFLMLITFGLSFVLVRKLKSIQKV
jgi:DHA1 family tetracycline resistance protein-like MFS transporter